MYLRLIACGLMVAPSSLLAQSVVPAAAAPIAAPATGNAVLRTGTQVPLRLLEQLDTGGKKLRPGQVFRMETAAPVMVDGMMVVPTGTPAIGEITDVRNKGMWGKSGRLAARVVSMNLNGRQIRLTGTFDDKGKSGGVGAVAVSALVFLPAGFFMTGKSAVVPIGTTVSGFVDEDVQLTMAAAAPMVVAVPTAASAAVPAVK